MLIGTPFGFWPAILLAYRSCRPNLWIVVCIWSVISSFSFPRDCSPRYLCNEDAENAHRQKYFVSMQRRCRRCASSRLFCLSLFPIGWTGGGRIRTFCRTKNICKKLKITFHPSTLGKVFDGSNQHRCRHKSALCRTISSSKPVLAVTLLQMVSKSRYIYQDSSQRAHHPMRLRPSL